MPLPLEDAGIASAMLSLQLFASASGLKPELRVALATSVSTG